MPAGIIQLDSPSTYRDLCQYAVHHELSTGRTNASASLRESTGGVKARVPVCSRLFRFVRVIIFSLDMRVGMCESPLFSSHDGVVRMLEPARSWGITRRGGRASVTWGVYVGTQQWKEPPCSSWIGAYRRRFGWDRHQPLGRASNLGYHPWH